MPGFADQLIILVRDEEDFPLVFCGGGGAVDAIGHDGRDRAIGGRVPDVFDRGVGDIQTAFRSTAMPAGST